MLEESMRAFLCCFQSSSSFSLLYLAHIFLFDWHRTGQRQGPGWGTSHIQSKINCHLMHSYKEGKLDGSLLTNSRSLATVNS
jgi:hypothetical protein